ncbi:MAG: flagellar assembly protein FliW [Pirellulaceae bacterium]
MLITTTRFGTIAVKPDEILNFAGGLIGYELCRQWLLLADAELDQVGWLQSVTCGEVAMAVISPRRFLPDYEVHVNRSQLESLELTAVDQAFVLNVLAMNEGRLTVNLRAPLIINLDRRIGRQVITTDEQPLQFELSARMPKLRRSA